MSAKGITLIATVLSIPAVLLAADDPFVGTWKLNLAKCKYNPGPPPKSQTYKFEPSGANGVKFTAEGVDARGNRIHREYTANYDGKDNPVTGNPDADSVSLKRVDAYTVEGAQKLAGKLVRTFRRAVSKDGKTVTVTEKGMNSHGQAYNNLVVYDRQSEPRLP